MESVEIRVVEAEMETPDEPKRHVLILVVFHVLQLIIFDALSIFSCFN